MAMLCFNVGKLKILLYFYMQKLHVLNLLLFTSTS